MDKYEYKLKLDELKELVQLQNYKAAAEIADEINWQKVRNANTLCMVADVYEAVERYDACQDVLMQAYDHSSVGRNIVGRLCDIAIKSKDVAAAEEFYNEFLELAPKDTQRYVFAYKIACLKNAPVTDRIAILEEFKEKEYSEMWAYELAVLYAQAGMREKCVETCDELILWFGDGEYVERALDLKRSFQPLTQAQEEKYQKFRTEKGMVEINVLQKAEATAAATAKAGLTTEEIKVTKFNTQNLQEEIAKSMQQIEDATEENTVRDQLSSIKKIVQDIPYLEGEEEVSLSNQEKIQKEVDKGLKTDFKEKLVEETTYGQNVNLDADSGVKDDTSGMSIEDILADWEKTKVVAREAMATAEQKKLDLEKERALSEANEIMKRLEELVPILSAMPGEDLPDTTEGTVADELLSAEPVITKAQPEEAEQSEEAEHKGTLSEGQAATRPLQQVISRTGRRERNPLDKMADVESLEDWSEEDDKVLEQVLADEMQESGASEGDAQEAEEVSEEAGAEAEEITQEVTVDVEEITEEAEEVAEDAEEITVEAEETTVEAEEIPTEFDQDTDATEKLDAGAQAPGAGETDDVGLSDEIREMFSYFIPIPGMSEQISGVLTNTVKTKSDAVTSSTGNLVIQGEDGSGKTILATDLIKATQKTMGREDDKIGKISAEALNTKDFAALVPKIAGGYLIIENAGSLSPETVAKMSAAMEQDTEGMTVLLEDDSEGIRQVLGIDPGFSAKFTERIKIPIFSIDELVDFGKAYAVEQECEIEEMAVLALYNRINNIQTLEHPTTLTEVKEIVDQAIENAEGGGIKKIFAKKYNDEDYLILHEEDFEQSV